MTRGVARSRDLKSQKAREFPMASQEPDDFVYGLVTKMLGNGRVEVACQDAEAQTPVTRRCRIRGNMRRREWIHPGDVVLVSLREFDRDHGDILFKYNAGEVAHLTRVGEYVPRRDPTDVLAHEEDEDIEFVDI